MEPSKDAISVRLNRINEQILGKSDDADSQRNTVSCLQRDTLLDILQVMFDECNNECLKTVDTNIANFVEGFRKSVLEMKRARVNIADFEIKAIIGSGFFGEVHVVKEKQTGDIYAMKTVRKTESSTFEHEKHIMAVADSPWLTSLAYSFQDCNNLYFVMEYHPGGDLLGLMYRQGGTIPESAAVFYIAEIVLALKDLHNLGYVHRDVKPDNVLLDRCGHIKLTDFGSAARMNRGQVTGGLPMGTPDYIAPEVLQSLENKCTKQDRIYGASCDYWSLGVIAYELIVGTTPFAAQNTTGTYMKIMNSASSPLKFPPDILVSQAYIQFVKLLLIEASKRLNYTSVRKHVVFKNINFDGIRDQVPPFVPHVSSTEDTSNFGEIKQHKRATVNIENFKRRTQFTGRQLPFVGFTYSNVPLRSGLTHSINVVQVKDELVENMRKEMDAMRKKLTLSAEWNKERDSLNGRLDETSRKIEALESLRDKLEKSLASNVSECAALKRTLEFERRDRSELEVKALELIKSSKRKWEASEKVKLQILQSEIEIHQATIATLTADKSKLNQQLETTVRENFDRQKSTSDVEKLRRSSVIGLESRLEKITTDTQQKIAALQNQISNLSFEKISLEKEVASRNINVGQLKENINILTSQLDDLKHKHEVDANTIKGYENKIFSLSLQNDSLKKNAHEQEAMQASAEQNINHIKDSLSQEITKNKNLSSKLNDIKSSMSQSKKVSESAYKVIEEKLHVMTEEHNTLEVQFKAISSDCDHLRSELKRAESKEESNREKVKSLEDLLARLENGVSKLENGAQSDVVLKEQIKRLEGDLVEVHESLTLEKHEHSQLKAKCWRVERDLGNAELDRKIVERDLKDVQTQLDVQKLRVTESETEFEKQATDYTKSIAELNETVRQANVSVAQIQEKNQLLETQLKDEQSAFAEEKMRVDILRKDAQAKEFKICSLIDNIETLKKEHVLLEQINVDILKELKNAQGKLESHHKDKLIMKDEILKLRLEIENHVLNRTTLREACTMLEEQLVEFEQIYGACDAKRKSAANKLDESNLEVKRLKNDLMENRRMINEERSLRHFNEARLTKADEEILVLQQECINKSEEVNEHKEYINKITQDLSEVETKLADRECNVRGYERQLDSVLAEIKNLKEENSAQRTAIGSLRDTNYKMGHDLMEREANGCAFVSRIKNLELLLNEKVHYYKERELKSSATIQQQIKLIDFLQTKVEESQKKKKTLTDKLFGLSRKENQAPSGMMAKDLEIQLVRERQQTSKLKTDFAKLQADLQSQVKTLKSGHKIVDKPHRFESKICKAHVTCGQCTLAIPIWRSCNVCRECQLTVHVGTCTKEAPHKCIVNSKPGPPCSSSSTSSLVSSMSVAELDIKDIRMEGWIKTPGLNSWEKRYACLTGKQVMYICRDRPHENTLTHDNIIHSVNLAMPGSYGKIILEPVTSEISCPVATSDLPFVIKIDVVSTTNSWKPQSITVMALSKPDKDKWFDVINGILKANNSPSSHYEDCLMRVPSELIINDLAVVLIEEQSRTITEFLLGTTAGLYSSKGTSQSQQQLLHISGPLHVHQILTLQDPEVAIMIVDDSRVLIQVALKHLSGLMMCAPCSNPTLKFDLLNIQDNGETISGFHMVRAPIKGIQDIICSATDKRMVIWRKNSTGRLFQPVRILDTAQPASFMHFTQRSLIIGADKIFEIQLQTLDASEFLDATNKHVQEFYKYTIPFALVNVDKIGYLAVRNNVCYFIDASRTVCTIHSIEWSESPLSIHYADQYLYAIFAKEIEIRKITITNEGPLSTVVLRLNVKRPQYLGQYELGIVFREMDSLRYVHGRQYDEAASLVSISENGKLDDSESERFSFNSSVVRALGDDDESLDENNRLLQFAPETQL